MKTPRIVLLACGALACGLALTQWVVSSQHVNPSLSGHDASLFVGSGPGSNSAEAVAPATPRPERHPAEDSDLQLPSPAQPGAEGVTPPDESSRTALLNAAYEGVVSRDLKLPSAAAWARFASIWNDATEVVIPAQTARQRIGNSIAAERYASGRFDEVLFEESQRVDGGFRTDSLTKLTHPDEYLSLRMLYREGGGQRFHIVRVPPGEIPRLDDATMEVRLAVSMRNEAISAFLREIASNR